MHDCPMTRAIDRTIHTPFRAGVAAIDVKTAASCWPFAHPSAASGLTSMASSFDKIFSLLCRVSAQTLAAIFSHQ